MLSSTAPPHCASSTSSKHHLGPILECDDRRAGHLFLTIPHLCLFLPPPHQTMLCQPGHRRDCMVIAENNSEYLLAVSKNLAHPLHPAYDDDAPGKHAPYGQAPPRWFNLQFWES